MKRELSVKPEPFQAVMKHPRAAALGAVIMALVCGGVGAAVASPIVAVVMALVGLAVGAPGGAHVAESAERS